MEKRAVVEVGRTPSEVSGKPSTIIKQGMALATGEKSRTSKEEAKLAKNFGALYNRRATS